MVHANSKAAVQVPHVPNDNHSRSEACAMSSALRRAALQLAPLRRGIVTSGATKQGAPSGKGGQLTHEEIVLGDGHHGLRSGYNYVSVSETILTINQSDSSASHAQDWEHGPNYLRPDTVRVHP